MYYIRVRAYDATTTTDLGSYRISTDNVKVKVRLCGISTDKVRLCGIRSPYRGH